VSSRGGAWARFRRNQLAVVGLLIVALFTLTALAAPLLPLADPNATAPPDRLQRPFAAGAPLGTDQLGRDMLARLVWGARVSLAVGVAATLAAALVGSTIGLVAAFVGGPVDQGLMRLIDMIMAFPYLLLALAIVAALGPGLLNALLAIAVVNIPFFARSVRGTTLGLVQREFIDAARMSGFSDLRILVDELLPNVLPIVVITMSTTLGWMILETAGLSFLGLGAQPPTADLGSMLGDGRDLVLTAPHVAVLPGLAILILVIGINLVGDGLRDLLDPRLAAGALSRPVARTDRAPAAERRRGLAAMAGEPLLALRGLATEFASGRGTVRAVDDVDLVLERGESVGIVGESGSGKSVTALSILGLVATPPGRIERGEVRFRGDDLLELPLARLQDLRGDRIADIFQDPAGALNPLMRVVDQVAETVARHQDVRGGEAHERARDLLARVGLEGRFDACPHELSGGQRQRVGIAMALANGPDVLIADEPTTALDVTTQARVLAMLDERRRDEGAALIFITHDLGVVSELCERLVVMYAGRIVESGPTADVFAEPRHPYTLRLLESVPVLGEPERALRPIEGLPPALDDLPAGCHFAPRCPLAEDACRRGHIALETVGPDHEARCRRHAELARG